MRRTDHSDLQQVDDAENSLALLFARQDYRDYFEREGFGAYLAWRVPEFSVVSVHVRNDTYRSLALRPGTPSWFARDRALRDNPAVDEGEAHAVLLRLERQPRRARRAHAGLLPLDRARARRRRPRRRLRLHPRARRRAQRAAADSPADDAGAARGRRDRHGRASLPPQKQFTLGGVDGLRAHAFGRFRGDQLLLGQAECTVALPCPGAARGRRQRLPRRRCTRSCSWTPATPGRDPSTRGTRRQRPIQVDGGVGLTTAEDNMRVYVARNLQRARASAVVSVRLQRPF